MAQCKAGRVMAGGIERCLHDDGQGHEGDHQWPTEVLTDAHNFGHMRVIESLTAEIRDLKASLAASEARAERLAEALRAFMAYDGRPQIHPSLYDSAREDAWRLADRALAAPSDPGSAAPQREDQ
jgi:hypothetical protein